MNTVSLKLLVRAAKRLPPTSYVDQNEYFIDVPSRIEAFPMVDQKRVKEPQMVAVKFVKVFYVEHGRKIAEWELVV